MSCPTLRPSRTDRRAHLTPHTMGTLGSALLAETPKLNIRTKNGLPREELRKQQIARLARQYHLKECSTTRDIEIARGALSYPSPVLTLNLRYMDNDDLALSAYVHEQGHWVLTERNRGGTPRLFEDPQQAFPNLNFRVRRATASFAAAIFISPSACWRGRPWQVEKVMNRHGVKW